VAVGRLLMLNRATASNRDRVIAYCAQDQEYAETILREFGKQAGIKLAPFTTMKR